MRTGPWIAALAVALLGCVGQVRSIDACDGSAQVGLIEARYGGAQVGLADAASDAGALRKDVGPLMHVDAGAPRDAGGVPTAGTDVFGVRKIYPTIDGGREWYLPDDANLNADPVFVPAVKDITLVRSGHPTVYETTGSGDIREVRMNVHSPSGAAWWQNVEATAYFRAVSHNNPGLGMDPHWELEIRGEMHGTGSRAFGQINDGVRAPPGTETWPWYPGKLKGDDAVLAPCLGTTYHANQYLAFAGADGVARTARVHFEKEIAHTDGYASTTRPSASFFPTGWNLTAGQWFGYKFVARNVRSTGTVHLEVWLDRGADDTWEKVAQTDDGGGWGTNNAAAGGCASTPYGYAVDEIITWAGPWVGFRSDEITTQFQKLSVREIGLLQ